LKELRDSALTYLNFYGETRRRKRRNKINQPETWKPQRNPKCN